jgi:hypothetical protein
MYPHPTQKEKKFKKERKSIEGPICLFEIKDRKYMKLAIFPKLTYNFSIPNQYCFLNKNLNKFLFFSFSFFFFLFVVPGLELGLRAYTLNHSISPFFMWFVY